MPLIALLLALIVIASVMANGYRHIRVMAEQNQAAILGHQIANYMNAAEERMTVDHTLSPGSYTASAWLKSKACGGSADKNYVPCNFKVQSRLLNKPIKIVITQDGDDRNKYESMLTIGPFGLIDNGQYQLKPALAGAAITAAKTYFVQNTNQFISASSTYALDRKKAIATINVLANQINGNVFVRRDGTVDMENHLVFDPNTPDSKRQLQHVSTLQMDGTQSTIKASKALTLTAANNDIRQTLSGTYINELANAGNVFLGNQSGVKGQSNVTVNDLTIHSMDDQKLTSLLGKKQVSSVFKSDGTSKLAITGIAGPTGRLFVEAYCSAWQYYASGVANLTLYRSGTQVAKSSGWVMEWNHEDHHSSAQLQLTWIFSGLPPYEPVSGISINCAGENGGVHDIGYWTMGV